MSAPKKFQRVLLPVFLLMTQVIPVLGHVSDNPDLVIDHKALDNVTITPAQENEVLQRQKALTNTSLPTATAQGQEHLYGKWEGPYSIPVIAINASLLPNGKVLMYDSVGDGATESFPDQVFTRTALWDFANNSISFGNTNLGYNIFCSGLAKLSSGQLFIAGGNANPALDGINQLTNYDPFLSANLSTQFTNVGTMFDARWYPSITPLANGEMLITGGGSWIPEVRQLNGLPRRLFNINENFAADRVFHWLQTAPNGNVAYLGPDSQLRYLNPNNGGGWQVVRERDGKKRGYGSFAAYGIGKVLVTGGGQPAEATAVKIDLTSQTPSSTTPMTYARRQHNLTVLPDGSILATGGFKGSAPLFDFANAVYAAELWNPVTGIWTELSDMQIHRAYHSTALLLPDARILSAGGGICGKCLEAGYHQKNTEIFSPPYLFRKDGTGRLASRPVISSVPASITPGSTFSINTANAGSIAKVSLIRLGSVTHSVNMEQNFIPLAFTKGTGVLNVSAPANNHIATPGYYMLFLINSKGVPSIAKILKINGGGTITIPGSTNNASLDTSKFFQFIAQVSKQCMGVPNSAGADAVRLSQLTCSGGTNQTFQLKPLIGKANTYNIINQNSNKCVDIASNSQLSGAAVQQYTCNGTTAQQFKFNDVGGSIYELVVQNGSQRCVDVQWASTAIGAPLQLWDCNGTNAQRFMLSL